MQKTLWSLIVFWISNSLFTSSSLLKLVKMQANAALQLHLTVISNSFYRKTKVSERLAIY
jgi:hypothetical protein